jgi:hypothetical protein
VLPEALLEGVKRARPDVAEDDPKRAEEESPRAAYFM